MEKSHGTVWFNPVLTFLCIVLVGGNSRIGALSSGAHLVTVTAIDGTLRNLTILKT